jgi:hypothetical protein
MAVGATYYIDQLFHSYLSTRGLPGGDPRGEAAYQTAKGNPLLKYLGVGGSYAQRMEGHPYKHDTTDAEGNIIDKYLKGKMSAQDAEKRLRAIASPAQLAAAGVTLKGKADVTVTVKDANGKTTGKQKVPVDLFPEFTQPAPQTKGKPVTRRGGN